MAWDGARHDCAGCAAETARLSAAFAADVVAGVYDADGYTPADRRAPRSSSRPARQRPLPL
jgi:hypothetical protein